MREKIVREMLRFFARRPPELFRRMEIRFLARATERAFGEKDSGGGARGADAALRRYAEYTSGCAERVIAAGGSVSAGGALPGAGSHGGALPGAGSPASVKTVRARLYREAYRLGTRVRLVSGLKRPGDLSRLVFFLYRGIGIEMDGELPGEVTVSGCYFSSFYTPGQCRLMSAMDAGIIAGICGGGRLRFTERITEGGECCRACLSRAEKGCICQK